MLFVPAMAFGFAPFFRIVSTESNRGKQYVSGPRTGRPSRSVAHVVDCAIESVAVDRQNNACRNKSSLSCASSLVFAAIKFETVTEVVDLSCVFRVFEHDPSRVR
jgi:hypothetical protein